MTIIERQRVTMKKAGRRLRSRSLFVFVIIMMVVVVVVVKMRIMISIGNSDDVDKGKGCCTKLDEFSEKFQGGGGSFSI